MNDVSKLTDEKIAEIVRTKDKEVYAEIIKRYQAKLMRYATYIINDSHMGADIVQESFIKAYVNLNSFNAKKKFSSWIYRIVHNETMNMLNKNKRQQPIDESIDIDSEINLEDEFIKNELIHHARECLSKMSLIYKEPLSLYYLEERSYEEISEILRIPIGTVGTRVNRAKRLMKKICQKQIK